VGSETAALSSDRLTDMEIQPTPKSKKVLVAGGSVGGMEAAVTAAKRGHKVILCEKSDALGGILKSEQIIPFKREMYELGLSLARQMEQEGVEVRMNTEVTPEYAEAEKADAVIIAVGSTPIIPPIPGIDGDQVVVVNHYYLEHEKVGNNVVVLGGGLAGCECAVHLAREGKTVHIVEMRDDVAVDANVRHRPALMNELKKQNVQIHTGYTGKEITKEGVLCQDAAGTMVLVPGESVICAVGQRAHRDVADSLLNCAPMVRQIGDCVRPSNICAAGAFQCAAGQPGGGCGIGGKHHRDPKRRYGTGQSLCQLRHAGRGRANCGLRTGTACTDPKLGKGDYDPGGRLRFDRSDIPGTGP